MSDADTLRQHADLIDPTWPPQAADLRRIADRLEGLEQENGELDGLIDAMSNGVVLPRASGVNRRGIPFTTEDR